ncbi:MAG TPA: histidinol dehydrogenase [Candidatus Baltobacteraceae bacterium]|nr:histidinol dehydrogenase [Candidatus Baltobacteraceae bacterium]
MLGILAASDEDALSGLYRKGWTAPDDVRSGVSAILTAVRDRGDAALLEYTRRFDAPGFEEDALRVHVPSLDELRGRLPNDVTTALERAAERIAEFHRRQLAADLAYTDADGTYYALKTQPLGAIAAYVPGGTAVLPSSVLMNVLPAKQAGVARIVVLTPPQRDGSISDAILFACALCGVDEVYAAGGAQAIAAAAYGTAAIAPVDKIVGPGNVWVTEAKRQVFGVCGIDGLAGPSEVLVVADENADPAFAAGELLAQAEHDPLARVALVSTSRVLLERCLAELERRKNDARSDIVAGVLERSTYIIHAEDRDAMFSVTTRFAPEHLSLQVGEPLEWISGLRNAGAVFCGPHTPVAWGDYIAGTNHVLPTSGAARFSSGLRTADFLRTFSVLQNSPARAKNDAPLVAALAAYEGLPNHARTALRQV